MSEMDQEFNVDMTIDVDWAGTEEQRVGQIPPEIGEQEFEIARISFGMQRQGENVNQKYVNLLCKQMSGEFPGTRSTFKFLGFGTKMGKRGTCQLGETKAFLVDIGRGDLVRPENQSFDPRELVGTTFSANVAHSTNPKTNQTAVWLNQPRPSGSTGGYVTNDEEDAAAAATMLVPQPAMTQVTLQPAQTPVAPMQAPVVDPKPAMPRRMRPVPQS
jgi:hypothetical protein